MKKVLQGNKTLQAETNQIRWEEGQIVVPKFCYSLVRRSLLTEVLKKEGPNFRLAAYCTLSGFPELAHSIPYPSKKQIPHSFCHPSASPPSASLKRKSSCLVYA